MAQTTLTFDDPAKVVDGTAGGSDHTLQYGDYVFTINAQGNWTANFSNGRFNFQEDSSVGGENFSITVTNANNASFGFYDYQISVAGTPETSGGWVSNVNVGNTNWPDDNLHGNGSGPYYYRSMFLPSDIPPVVRSSSLTIFDADLPGMSDSGTMMFWLDNITVDFAVPPPVVTQVNSANTDGLYKVGDVIALTVTFDQAVHVTGTPQLILETGAIDRIVDYTTGTGTNTLTFTYTVQQGDMSADLDYISTAALGLNGGTIRNIDGAAAIRTLPSPGTSNSLGSNKAIVVDGVSPTAAIHVADTALAAGETTTVTIAFSEAVTGFTLGSLNVSNGTLSNLTTSDNITYTATLAPASNVTDATNVITLTSGTVRDVAGNEVSASSSNNYAIDTQRPAVTAISRLDSTPAYADVVRFSVTFSESVSGVSVDDFTLAVTGTATGSISVSGSGNTYTVVVSEISGDGTLKLDVNGSNNIVDQAGNGALSFTAGEPYEIIAHAPPVVTASTGTTAFVEGANAISTPVLIDAGITLSDPDSAHLASARISIGNFVSGQDVLTFVPNAAFGNITGSYDAATGILSLTSSDASATLAQWQAALRSVGYTNTSDLPSTTDRIITFSVSDGDAASNLTAKTVTIASVNDAPQFHDLDAAPVYKLTKAAVMLDTDLTLIDPDLDTMRDQNGDYSGTVLTVQRHGGANPNDQFLVGGGFYIAGATLYGPEGDQIATVTQNSGGVLEVAFAGPSPILVTSSLVNAFLRSLSYANTGSVAETVRIDLTFSDGNAGMQGSGGTKSATGSIDVTVLLPNEAPVLTGDLKATVKEGASYTLTTADLYFIDPDDLPADVRFTVSSQTAGKVFVNGYAAGSFTGAELAAGKVAFKHDGSETTNASFKVAVEDGNEDISAPVAKVFNFTVAPINDAPKLVTKQVLTSIAENASTASARKVAELAIVDPDGGDNRLSLGGSDAKLFEIKSGALWLKKGVGLDYETNPSLDVTVRLDDPSIGVGYEASKSFKVTVKDVAETVSGPNGADQLTGTSGNDILDGKGGNDIIKGGAGNDTLIGGTGVDKLFGGAGRDVFVFHTTKDSAPGIAGLVNNSGYTPASGLNQRDIIADFVRGEDKLDLSHIDANTKVAGDQAFTWRGAGNFTGKSGDLIYRTFDVKGTANDKTIVYGDSNLDGRADFQIELTGIINLSKGDFIL